MPRRRVRVLPPPAPSQNLVRFSVSEAVKQTSMALPLGRLDVIFSERFPTLAASAEALGMHPGTYEGQPVVTNTPRVFWATYCSAARYLAATGKYRPRRSATKCTDTGVGRTEGNRSPRRSIGGFGPS